MTKRDRGGEGRDRGTEKIGDIDHDHGQKRGGTEQGVMKRTGRGDIGTATTRTAKEGKDIVIADPGLGQDQKAVKGKGAGADLQLLTGRVDARATIKRSI